MALSKDVVIRLLGDADSAVKAQKAAADAAGVATSAYKRAEREYDRQQKAMETASRKQRAAMESVGRGATVAGAAIVAGLGVAVKAAVDWESAWTGVLKTVNGSPAQLAKLEAGLRGLTRVLPATHQEIAAVAEAAGQMGVATDSIVDFTKVMINLGETTNLTADEAATSLAQMMNVMKTAPDDVGRMGATLVALGNAGASTEADIMDMSKRLAGAGQLIGASESDVMALASAMADLGIKSELGGGSMSRVMLKIYSALQEGGDAAKGFADVAGMSADDFAAKWQSDPMQAIDAFVQGLGRVKGEGGNVVSTLSDLGIKGTENLQVMLSMAGAGDKLTKSLKTGNDGWRENTALIQEAAKRYDTTAAKTEMARNALNDAAIEIGETFLPMLSSLASGVADVATWFANLPDPIKAVLGTLGGVAGVAGLAGGAFLLLAPRVMETYKAFQALKGASPGVASGLASLGKAAGIAGGVIAASAALDSFVHSLEPAPPTMEATTKALLGMKGGFGQLDEQFSGMSSFVVGDIDGLNDAIARLVKPSNLEGISDWTAKVITLGGREGNDTREALINQFHQMGDALALMVQNGNADLAAQQFDLLAEKWKQGGGNVDELMGYLPGYKEALDGVANEQATAAESAKLQADQTATLAQTAGAAYADLASYAAALGLSEDATKDLIDASNQLGESLGEFVDPLGAYTGLLEQKQAAEEETARKTAEATGDSKASWKDYVRDVGVSFEEYMKALEDQVRAQDDWQLNMLRLAGRVSEGTLAELSRMGPEGAPLVADLVNRSDKELSHMDDLFAERSEEATNAWGAQLKLAAPVLAAVGRQAGQGVVDELTKKLQAGTITVAQIAAQYGINLAGGINPILASLGKQPIHTMAVSASHGGRGKNYADGGIESHVAQIAPAGAWRVWAEPETGGEAYIPLSPDKRGRSLDIWRQTGRLLGADVTPYAWGGINDVPRPPSTRPYGSPISTAGDAAMDKVYGDTVDWVKAHLAPDLGPGIGWQAMWQAISHQFPGANLHSSFRPGAITATGNRSYHSMGRAIDITPSMEMFNWIAQQYGAKTKELIFSPAGGRQLHNGAPHMYSGITRAMHWDHVHWAMAKGGILNPHIRDNGGPLLPGYTYNGLGRPEQVVPMPATPAGAAMAVTVYAQFGTETIEAHAVRVVADREYRRGVSARSS